MEDKIKVKDLATDLGVSTKDIVRVLRAMDVEVKSSASSVGLDIAAKAKSRLQPESSSEIMRKEIQPGIIVRRRRVIDLESDAAGQAEISTPPGQEHGKEAEITAKEAPKSGVADAASPDAVLPDAAVTAQDDQANLDKKPPRQSRKKTKTPVETPPARIVRPVEPPAPVRQEAEKSAPVEEKTVAPKDTPDEAGVVSAPEEAKESAVPPAPTAQEEPKTERQRRAPAASAEPEAFVRPSLLPPVSEAKRQRGQEEEGEGFASRKKPAGQSRHPERPEPQVRVISRPDTSAPKPAAEAGARGEHRPPRPAGGGRSGSYSGMPRSTSSFTPFDPQQVPVEGADQSRKKRNKGRRTVDFPQSGGEDFSRRRSGGEDDEVRGGRPRSRTRKPKKTQTMPQSTQPMKAAKRKIRVEESIRVADFAHQMGVKSGEIIKILFGLGVMATINNALDIDTATLVAAEFGYEVEKVGFFEEEYLLAKIDQDRPEQLKPRPPVVTIMGHVDHGKTSLLDAIRKTSVTSGEAGGITQHIGAYHVETKRGSIVFLDTPGHEAFTAMRARGAQLTDLVVLVVAADDGVMEQTREAINHSKAAGVPILVAVNKMDKEAANPDRVLRELAELGLQAEAWGGDTVVGYVSAKTGQGLDELLELIALQSEIMELTANPDKLAKGHVVEAKLDKGRGPVATVLIQEGTLRQGDAFVCGVFAGRVRAMFDDQGRKIKEAEPSIPVEIQGFEGVPEAGEEFVCLADEKAAKRIAEARAVKQRERELAKESRVTLETFLSRSVSAAETQVLNLVLKADVQGSLEAITEALRKLSTPKVRIAIIHGGAGAISESDIMLAAASNAIIIGFNIRPTAKVKDVAEQEHVEIRFYDVIYKLVEEIRSAMTGMLAPIKKEVYLGQAEVRDTFSLPRVGIIAGCFVADGKIVRNAGVRLLRDGVVVYTGKISSLKHFKDDAREMPKGMECGMGLENFNDIKVGDIIEAFETVEEAATL